MPAYLDRPPREIMPVANLIHGLVLRLTAAAATITVLLWLGYYGYALLPLTALAIIGNRAIYMCYHFSWFRRWLLLQLVFAVVLTVWAMHLAAAGSNWWFGALILLLWAEGVGHYLNAENVKSFATAYHVPREHGDEDPD